MAKYNRILLKLSGEVLGGEKQSGFDFEVIEKIASVVKRSADLGTEIGIVVGGGNFWRGRSSGEMDRTKADKIGMLATMMNSIMLSDAFCRAGLKTKVMSAVDMPRISETFDKEKALQYFSEGYAVIFGGGTGNPFFSTDSGAALRAAEIEADCLFKATNVDGVYDKDPNEFPDAKRFDEISAGDILKLGLKVMDASAAAICKDAGVPILVFDLTEPENVIKALNGESIGTVVTNN